MIYAVEAWTFFDSDDEEPTDTEMVTDEYFEHHNDAKEWAWQKMQEGFYVRLWIREATDAAKD